MGLFDKKEKIKIEPDPMVKELKDSLEKEIKGRERDKELHTRHLEKVNVEYEAKISRLKLDQELALKQKEFDIAHFKDAEIKKAEDKNSKLEQEIAVVKKENEMLIKITDLNADVIDVKELVTKLINKLPEVKINSLSVNAPTQTSK